MKLNRTLLAVAVTLPVIFSPAYAGMIVNEWTLDTNGATGQGLTTVVTGIDEILFTAVAHATSPGGIVVGQAFMTEGKGIVTQFNNISTGIISAPGLNANWELSFIWSAGGVYTNVDTTSADFIHTTPGTIKFYIDDITDGSKATPGTGFGYADGALFATFDILNGGGGGLFFATSDGSDDTSWLIDLAGSIGGVIFDKNGNDLGLNPTTDLHTDSNFDANPRGGAPFSFVSGGFVCGKVTTDFCAKEDGSAVLTVPEPASLALMGLGLVGMGMFSARRRKTA